jgi:hypothetical protein
MGSSDPLGTPKADYPDTQDSDTVVLEDDYHLASPGVGASTAPHPGVAAYADAAMKRKRHVVVGILHGCTIDSA